MMDMSELAQAKILSAFSCFVLAVLGCWVARFLELDQGSSGLGINRRRQLLTFGNTLAAGILLAAGLVHMLPDAIKALSGVSTFPVASTIAGASFVFLVLIGELAESLLAGAQDAKGDSKCTTSALTARPCPLAPNPAVLRGSEDTYHEPAKRSCAGPSDNGGGCRRRSEDAQRDFNGGRDAASNESSSDSGSVENRRDESSTTASRGSSSPERRTAEVGWHPLEATAGPKQSSVDLEAPLLPKAAPIAPRCCPSKTQSAARVEHVRRESRSHSCVADAGSLRTSGNILEEVKSFLLFFALVFHSVMEGLGVGSAQDAGVLLGVVIAIVAHKGLAAFALGSALMQSDLPQWKFWAFVAIFSMSTPAGCLIGSLSAAIGSEAEQSLANGVCIAVASGTFLKVSTTEMLPRALAEKKARAIGALGLSVGFAAMSILAIWC